MSSVITTDFERWKAQEAALGKPVALNEFVFANVPGLDPSKDISRDEKLPPAGQIVHRQAVNKAGLASENAVAYSVTLGTDTGDFVFNWIGLINKESGTLAMITHAPEQRKIKTVDGVQGNVLTRSFLLEFNGAAKETQITTSAETWQIDFTARLAGMDEIQRLANRDIYGASAFFGDGFLVTKAAEQYRVTPGTAYIEGLRGTLDEITTFNNLRDTKIYADFTFQGNLVSKWQTFVKVATAKTLAHYQDAAGFQHYVAVIAEIDQNGNITDKRVKGTAIDRELAELKKELPIKYQPIGDYATKAEVSKKLDKTGGQMSGTVNFSTNNHDAYDVISLPIGNQKKNKLRTFRGGLSETLWHEAVDGDNYILSTGVNGDAAALSLSHGAGLRTSGKITPGDYSNFDSRYSPNLSVPIGASIIWNSSSTIPDNFWPHEGRSFSASEYPELAKILPGLKIPDDRGYGIRIADNGRGIDSGRTVGTYQDDAVQNIVGDLRSDAHGFISILPIKSTGALGIRSKGQVNIGGTGTLNPTYDFDIDVSRVARTADETRMKNVAKILIMRVK